MTNGNRYVRGRCLCTYRQALSQQQQSQASVSAGKELTPAHQASIPQAPRTNPVYQSTGYTNVTAQVCRSTSTQTYLLTCFSGFAFCRPFVFVQDSLFSNFFSVHRTQHMQRIRRIHPKSYRRPYKCNLLHSIQCIQTSD